MQLQSATHCKLSGFILGERCAASSKMEAHRYVGAGFLWASVWLEVRVDQSNLLRIRKGSIWLVASLMPLERLSSNVA